MKFDQMKKGFFGYQKASVYEYITKIEEEFSSKFMEKEEQYQQNEEQYRNRIAKLEEELREVREQLEQKREEQMTIASTLLDATRYAESLRQEAEEKREEENKKWAEELAAKQRELNQYYAQILNVREMFCNLLQDMEEQASRFENQVEMVKTAAPGRNMALFERKTIADA